MKEPVLFKADFMPGPLPEKQFCVKAHSHLDSYEEVLNQSGHSTYLYEVEEGGSLEAVHFQNVSDAFEVRVTVKVILQKDAKAKLTVIQRGGSKAQFEVEMEVRGSGAEIDVRGLQNSQRQQKLSFTAHARHFVPHTSSNLQVWCVAGDESHSIFNGLVTIEKGAHHTEANQRNKNLLLSSKATVDTFPKLFIANHDVKCAHGSSVSQIEPEQFYYLQARGIDAEAAEKMLVQGFMNQALDGVTHASTRLKLENILGLTEEAFL